MEGTLALPDKDLMAAIAVTRFGLGGMPGELDAVRGDPQGFLKSQIRKEGADQPPGNLPNSMTRLTEFHEYQVERQQQRRALASNPDMAKKAIDGAIKKEAAGVQEDFQAKSTLAMTTQAAFRERWTAFWCDHFTVSAVKLASANQAGPFEREAIRPHVFGRFEDMLVASSTHPGMLVYLDQAQSIGPNSQAAVQARFRPDPPCNTGAGPGLNENLAREIMELHSVGLGRRLHSGRRHRIRPGDDRPVGRHAAGRQLCQPSGSSIAARHSRAGTPAPSWARPTPSMASTNRSP